MVSILTIIAPDCTAPYSSAQTPQRVDGASRGLTSGAARLPTGVIGNSRPADLTLWSAELFPCSADLIPGSLG
jgi:hypothetical protein